MTDATVLADALVEAGILVVVRRRWPPTIYSLPSRWIGPLWNDEQAITDWRVAGKVLESMTPGQIRNILAAGRSFAWERLKDPRAIIEAWYAATKQGESDDGI